MPLSLQLEVIDATENEQFFFFRGLLALPRITVPVLHCSLLLIGRLAYNVSTLKDPCLFQS